MSAFQTATWRTNFIALLMPLNQTESIISASSVLYWAVRMRNLVSDKVWGDFVCGNIRRWSGGYFKSFPMTISKEQANSRQMSSLQGHVKTTWENKTGWTGVVTHIADSVRTSRHHVLPVRTIRDGELRLKTNESDEKDMECVFDF